MIHGRGLSVRAACHPGGCCFIVPPSLLGKLAVGHPVIPSQPQLFSETLLQTQRLRADRDDQLSALPERVIIPQRLLQQSPTRLFDCENEVTLPGDPVSPGAEPPGWAAIVETTDKVREFYKTVLGRDSIDNKGMPMLSSLNYGKKFQNAFWSGQVIVYGNGDQDVFVDFWHAPDAICHEITHGVTEFESGLIYSGEPGAVNESISDCMAAVFRQRLQGLPAADPAGWQLGGGFLGPKAIDGGFTCLRDMTEPTGSHCLVNQPSIYPNRDPAGDVHVNSGIPNRAFALFARAIGGNSWEAPIKLWYSACTAHGLKSDASIADFAACTLRAAEAWTGPQRADLVSATTKAWATVQVTPTP